MPITHELFQPHEKSASNGNHARKSMVAYKAGLATNDQYRRGDLCTVDTDGTLKKFISDTAADAVRLCVADQDYVGDASGLLEKNPTANIFHKITHLEGKWVMNLTGTASANPAGARRNISCNSSDRQPKVQAGSTAVAVNVLGFDGDAVLNDVNAPVVVEFVESVRY